MTLCVCELGFATLSLEHPNFCQQIVFLLVQATKPTGKRIGECGMR